MKLKRYLGMGVFGWIVLVILALISLLILVLIFFEARKVYWDHEVKNMCEKDGGATVFEQVHLSQEKYKQLGGVNETIPVPPERYKKDSPYFARTITSEIREWDPEVKKLTTEIVRRKDKKVLGIEIIYMRIGGGISLGIAHPSSFSCRDVAGVKLGIEKRIFVIDGIRDE